jgi:hypothetical protein
MRMYLSAVATSEQNIITGYQSMTIQQARQIVQQEHSSQAANIIAECGYRACFLQRSSSGGSASLTAVTLLTEVCNPALVPTSSNVTSSGDQLSVSPRNATVIFNSGNTQERTIEVKNGTAGSIRVRGAVDPGPDSRAQGIVSILGQSSFVVGPHKSLPVRIAIRKAQSEEPLFSIVTFTAVDDPAVAVSTGLILVPSALFLLPPPSVASG